MAIGNHNDLTHIVRTSDQWKNTYDKYELIPTGVLCVELVSSDVTKIKIGDGHNIFSKLPYIGDLDLSKYYTKLETDTRIKEILTQEKVVRIKGLIGSKSNLPADARCGDIYFVRQLSSSDNKYIEYIYSPDNTWEPLGGIPVDIDLSEYAKTAYVDDKIEQVNERIDDIEQHGTHTHANKDILDLITAAFTAEEKDKLSTLYNYDDTELRELITQASHTHSNKDILDAISAAFTAEDRVKLDSLTPYDDSILKEKITALERLAHEHSNKRILDRTTASFTTEYERKMRWIRLYTGCTGMEEGIAGLVPAAQAGEEDYVLSGSGEWVPQTGGGGTYELPIASASTLGGIKVGNGLEIDANGVLSTTGGGGGGDSIAEGDGITITTDPQTGVKTISVNTGDNLEVDPNTGELNVTGVDYEAGQGIRIGSNYNFLEYIKNSGNYDQIILTDIVPLSTDKIELDIKFGLDTGLEDNLPLFGIRKSSSNPPESMSIFLKTSNPVPNIGFFNHFFWTESVGNVPYIEYPTNIANTESNQRQILTISQNYGTWGTQSTRNYSSLIDQSYGELTSGISVFGYVYNETKIPFKTKQMSLYGVKIYNSSNVLIHDLVPVERVSDNAVGLYDVLTNKFYDNAGNGSFIKGPVVTAPDRIINAKIGNGLQFDSNNAIEVNTGNGLSVNQDNELEVNTGNGLQINQDGELEIDPSIIPEVMEYSAGEAITIRDVSSTLPAGYVEVDYIEGVGNYTVIDYIPNRKTKIVGTASQTQTSYDPVLFGNRTGSNGQQFVFWFNRYDSTRAKVGFVYGTNTWSTSSDCDNGKLIPYTLEDQFTFLISLDDEFNINDSFVHNITENGAPAYNLKLGIFALVNTPSDEIESSDQIFRGRIYEFKIYEDDELVVNLIPAISTSTNQGGFYDVINDIFYTSKTATPFGYDPSTIHSTGKVIDVNYGNGLTVNQNNELEINTGDGLSVNANNEVEISKATANTIGGIKVGDGLSIESDGTLSVVGGSGGGNYTAGDAIEFRSTQLSFNVDAIRWDISNIKSTSQTGGPWTQVRYIEFCDDSGTPYTISSASGIWEDNTSITYSTTGGSQTINDMIANTQKMCAIWRYPNHTMQLTFNLDTAVPCADIAKFRIKLGDDVPDRDPKSWKVYFRDAATQIWYIVQDITDAELSDTRDIWSNYYPFDITGATSINVKYGTGLAIDPITGELFVDGQLPEGTIIKKLTYVGDGSTTNSNIHFSKKPLSILSLNGSVGQNYGSAISTPIDAPYLHGVWGGSTGSGTSFRSSMSYDDTTNTLSIQNTSDVGLAFNISGTTYTMYYLTKGHAGSGTSENNEVSVIKSFTYVGDGTNPNNIQFPETPDMLVTISAPGGDNTRLSAAPSAMDANKLVIDVSDANNNNGVIGCSMSFNSTTNVLTLSTTKDISWCLNMSGTTYTVFYAVNEVIASQIPYDAGEAIEITEVTHGDEFRVQNQEYFFNTRGLTCGLNARVWTTVNDGDILAAMCIHNNGGNQVPLFVGVTEDSVKVSQNYDSTILGPNGSFDYLGKTWYFTADYALSGTDGQDTQGHIQTLPTTYSFSSTPSNFVPAAKDLIDLAVLLSDLEYPTISVKYNKGLTVNQDNELEVNIGTGLEFDQVTGAINVTGGSGGDTVEAGDGIDIDTDSQTGNKVISIDTGNGLQINQDGEVEIDPSIIPEVTEYEAGTAISIEDVEHGGVTFDAWDSGTGWENVCYQASTGNAVVTYTYEAHSPISNSYTIPAGATHIRAIAYDQNDTMLWTSFSWIDANNYHFASTTPENGHYDDWFIIPTGAVKVNFGVRHSKLDTTIAMSLNDIKSVDITIQTVSKIEVDVWNGGSGWLNGNYYSGTSDTFTTSWYYSYHSDPNAYIPIPNGATHLMVMGISNENDSHFAGGGVNVFSAESHSNHIDWWSCAWEWHEISSDARFVQIDVKWNDNNTRTISGSDIKSVTLVWKLPALEINQAINVKYGNGLTVNQNNELEVKLGDGLSIDEDGAIEVTGGGSGGDSIAEGEGITITTDSQTGVKTIGVNVGAGLDIDPITNELFVNGQLPEGTIIKKLTYTGNGEANNIIHFTKKPLGILTLYGLAVNNKISAVPTVIDATCLMSVYGNGSGSDRGGTVVCSMSYNDTTNELTLSQGPDVGARYNVSGETYQMFYLTKGHTGSGTSVNNEVSVIKTITYTGTGTATNNIQFPETPDFILSINGKDGVSGDMVVFSFDNLHPSDAHQYIYTFCYNAGISSNYFAGGHGTFDFNPTTNVLTLTGADQGAACNYLDRVYYLRYVVNEVIPSTMPYAEGDAISIETIGGLQPTNFSNNDFVDSIVSMNAGSIVKAADKSSFTLTASGDDCYTRGSSGQANGSYPFNVKASTKYRFAWDSADPTVHGKVYTYENGLYDAMMHEIDQYDSSYLEFTTSPNTTFIQARFGVMYGGNSITYSNVRLYEVIEDEDQYNEISVKHGDGLIVNERNELEVRYGNGLEIVSNSQYRPEYYFNTQVQCQVHTDSYYSTHSSFDRTFQKTTTEPALCCIWEVGDSGSLWTGPLLVGTTATSVQYTTQDTQQTVTYQNTFQYLGQTWYTSGYPDFLNAADHEDKLGYLQYLGSYPAVSNQIQAAKDLIDLALINAGSLQAKLGTGLSFDANGAIQVTGGGGGSGDTVAQGAGIEITTDQQTGNKVIAVNPGSGLQVDQTTNELEIDDSVVTEDDELNLVFVPDDYQPS